MTVAVCMPWRFTPDRLAAFNAVTEFYRAALPGASLHLGDSSSQTFNRAGARNDAVRQAGDVDVVVVADADTIPDTAALRAAVDAAGDGRLHLGYDRFVYLTAAQTRVFLAGDRLDVQGVPHNSSVLVCTPGVWWAAGGQDERFDGWGGEDDAFFVAVATLIGPPVWHDGLAVSLWHEPCRDVFSDRWKPNGALAARYVAANGDRDAMRALIAERRS